MRRMAPPHRGHGHDDRGGAGGDGSRGGVDATAKAWRHCSSCGVRHREARNGAAKGRLGVDDPHLAIQGSEKGTKGRLRLQRRQGAREIEAPLSKGSPEAGHELATKECPQNRDREEEARTGVDPPGAVRRQAAHRDDAVDVGMVLQALPPRVQDHQAADGASQALRVGGDLEEGLRGGAKQEVVHHALVDERETGERLRHREDDVDVPDGQEFLLAGRDPRVPHSGQTLGAMPVLYERAGCAHWSQRSRCPPSADVRHCAMARRTRRCTPITQARCVSTKRSLCWRTMSATSKGGRVTAYAADAIGGPSRAPGW
jgi:hypothetical protein